ncbi:ABC transporter permease [Nocardioides sp.]|uniref:ABC transporter permease n=1 Tax=Nocardioides sp. TaxID=35761 RepID=UPI002F3F39AF
MSRLRLCLRLAARDVRRRAGETALLFTALAVAATTLTIGLVLHGQTAAPYDQTRQRTNGPDVVAALFPAPNQTVTPTDRARLREVAAHPEVSASSRAFPTTWTSIEAHGISGVAEVQGRDTSSSPVDRPQVVSGRWVGRDGVVLERAFARAMGVSVGDSVQLGGRAVPVVGIAVSAALPPYPQLCTIGCILDQPGWFSAEPGLVWATRHRVTGLDTPQQPLVWFQYLALHDPSAAPGFVQRYDNGGPPAGRPELTAWQDIAARQAEQLANERIAVAFGGTLLVMLALATLVVLVGGRMSDEVRRVGMLKAAGASPGFVTGLLLTSYLAIGAGAAMVGLAVGRLLSPLLVGISAGLLGHVGGTSVTFTNAAVVFGAVLGIVVLAAAVPAWRAARTSTVRALTDSGHRPRRHRLLVALSARLPGPALLGLRLTARRLRRAALTGFSVAVAVCAGTVVLFAQSSLHAERGNAGGPADPQVAQLHTVTTALTLLLAVMAMVNLVFVTRSTAVDARRVLAVARTVGVSPAEAAVALGVSQLVPALIGIAAGFLAGAALFHALSSSHPTTPATAQIVGLGLLTVGITVALTAIPARWEARRPIAEILREN